jgi:hypothetical protein
LEGENNEGEFWEPGENSVLEEEEDCTLEEPCEASLRRNSTHIFEKD